MVLQEYLIIFREGGGKFYVIFLSLNFKNYF